MNFVRRYSTMYMKGLTADRRSDFGPLRLCLFASLRERLLRKIYFTTEVQEVFHTVA